MCITWRRLNVYECLCRSYYCALTMHTRQMVVTALPPHRQIFTLGSQKPTPWGASETFDKGLSPAVAVPTSRKKRNPSRSLQVRLVPTERKKKLYLYEQTPTKRIREIKSVSLLQVLPSPNLTRRSQTPFFRG